MITQGRFHLAIHRERPISDGGASAEFRTVVTSTARKSKFKFSAALAASAYTKQSSASALAPDLAFKPRHRPATGKADDSLLARKLFEILRNYDDSAGLHHLRGAVQCIQLTEALAKPQTTQMAEGIRCTVTVIPRASRIVASEAVDPAAIGMGLGPSQSHWDTPPMPAKPIRRCAGPAQCDSQ
jgi:hypothetical protein